MNYQLYSGILILFGILCLLWIYFIKGERKLFFKRTYWFWLITALIFTFIGGLSWLLITYMQWSYRLSSLLIGLVALGLGVWFRKVLYSYHYWTDRENGNMELPFSLFTMILAIGSFFGTGWLLEFITKRSSYLFDNLSGSIFLFLLPFLLEKCFIFFKRIPSKKILAYYLPLDETPQDLVFSESLKIRFMVPVAYRNETIKPFYIHAPKKKSIGEIFHYLVYRNNVRDKSITPIEIAENNQRSKIYGWLFYRKEKKTWWGSAKNYIDPAVILDKTELRNGDKIFVERIKK